MGRFTVFSGFHHVRVDSWNDMKTIRKRYVDTIRSLRFHWKENIFVCTGPDLTRIRCCFQFLPNDKDSQKINDYIEVLMNICPRLESSPTSREVPRYDCGEEPVFNLETKRTQEYESHLVLESLSSKCETL